MDYAVLFSSSKQIHAQGRASPASIYLLKVNNNSTRKRSEICSNLTIKTPERRGRRCEKLTIVIDNCSKLTIVTSGRHYWLRSGVFAINFKHISHLNLVSILLTLNSSMFAENLCYGNLH